MGLIGLVALVVLVALVILLPTPRADKAVAFGALAGLVALALFALWLLRGPDRTPVSDLPPGVTTTRTVESEALDPALRALRDGLLPPALLGFVVYSVIGLARQMSAAFAERARSDRSAFFVATSLAVLALAACGVATEPQAPPEVSTPDDVVALIDSPRLTSVASAGAVVTAEGQASRSGGDDLRTYWFTSIGAIAHVQHLGGSLIVRRVLDGTTLFDEHEGEEPVGRLTDPATFLSEEEMNDLALRWADEAEANVEVNYVPFFGGAAEFVVRPDDELEFMRELDSRMYELFREFPQEPRPYLLTIVDSSGANRRVQGGFLLSDPDQGWQRARLSDGTRVVIAESDGFAWQADDLTKVLGVDASGRSIAPPVEGPVEKAPGP